MLKGIAPCISPDLLKVLAEMGHGDEIVLADAHFPGHTMNERVLRADGLSVTTLLDGILPLFDLDTYADPLVDDGRRSPATSSTRRSRSSTSRSCAGTTRRRSPRRASTASPFTSGPGPPSPWS